MTAADASLFSPDFLTVTLGIVVYLIGVALTRRIALLRSFSIPEPVTGGLLVALAIWVFHAVTGLQIDFDMSSRDLLLVLFFASVGLNARLGALLAGGRTLAILCVITVAYVFMQNGIGAFGAWLFGLPSAAGVMMGSVALVGGHGTTIAWAPTIAAEHGFPEAMVTGTAVATLGLILASVLGGPVAKFLIERRGLKGEAQEDTAGDAAAQQSRHIDKDGFMHAMLAVNVAVLLGYLVHGLLTDWGVQLPLFVPCLVMGIVITNTVPFVFPRLPWPAQGPALKLISDYALSTFLAISLMSIQLWTLAGMAGPLLTVIALQAIVAIAFIVGVVFPLLGRTYQAAVLSAGFTGLSLGATPTAIASMTAVTQRYGPSPNAFVLLPLVSAFFVDIVNVVAIDLFLRF